MASLKKMAVSTKPSVQSLQSQLLERFNNPLDCLTAHLMLESSEVLAGVKPANLASLVIRTRSFDRNLHQLWHRRHEGLAARPGDLTFKITAGTFFLTVN